MGLCDRLATHPSFRQIGELMADQSHPASMGGHQFREVQYRADNPSVTQPNAGQEVNDRGSGVRQGVGLPV